jgi:alpha-ketoglutarate-dependent taurine dioxygenase
VVWDNLRTVHAATPFDHGLHPREMWRTTVAAPETTAFTTVGLPD